MQGQQIATRHYSHVRCQPFLGILPGSVYNVIYSIGRLQLAIISSSTHQIMSN